MPKRRLSRITGIYVVQSVHDGGDIYKEHWRGKSLDAALRKGRALADRGLMIDVILRAASGDHLLQSYGA